MKEIYPVLSAAMGQETRMDQIANNLANVNSIGFKQDRAIFENLLAQGLAGASTNELAGSPSIAGVASGFTDFAAGPALHTGGSFDFMIEGDGFFEIESEDGLSSFYTRAGNFTLNSEGELVTQTGLRVLDEGSSTITLAGPAENFSVNAAGEMTMGDTPLGTLGVVGFADLTQLEKFGDGLFKAAEGAVPAKSAGANLRHGYLEGSNVNPIEEMVRMIETQRAFEQQQKAIQSIDQIRERRINQILNG